MNKQQFPVRAMDERVTFVDYTWLISGTVYEGGSEKLLDALMKRGINECYFYNVAGAPIGRKTLAGVADSFDVENFHIVVSADQADNVFEFVYEFCEMYEPNKGVLFMNKLSRSTHNRLPDLAHNPEEDLADKTG